MPAAARTLATCPSGGYNVDMIGSIPDKAFYNCLGLTSVTMGDFVDSIGDSAFYYCSNLKNVTIGNSVISIGDYAFYGCRA